MNHFQVSLGGESHCNNDAGRLCLRWCTRTAAQLIDGAEVSVFLSDSRFSWCMACVNSTLSSMILIADPSSYGLIGLVSLGLLLYLIYLIIYIRNYHSTNSSSTVYIHFSQLSLMLLLLSPLAFLFRSSASMEMLCPFQTLSLQILPFCVLLGFNVHFVYEWLMNISNTIRNSFLIACTSFLIFFLAILIQSAVLLIWFYNQTNSPVPLDSCADHCFRPLFLGSLTFEFFLLFIYSLQSSLRYHLSSSVHNRTYLLASLLALCVTLSWVCLYLFLPLRRYFPFSMDNDSILAYGKVSLAYAFLGPMLLEQFFYRRRASVSRDRSRFHHVRNSSFESFAHSVASLFRSIKWHLNVSRWQKNSNERSWLRISSEI